MQESWVRSLGWEDPLEEGWQRTPVCLSGEFYGQRSLVGYSPWGCKELDVNLQLNTQVLNNKLNWTFLFLNEVFGFLLKQNHGTFLYLRVARKIMVPTRIFTQWQGKLFLY